MGLGAHLPSSHATLLLSHRWTKAIQIVAMVSSAFSITATLITIYWFFMMRRNFRRNLVLYLILSDFFKSLWYVVFSATSLHYGSINSSSAFCQGTGFSLQASTMSCDFAILVMAVHMYLQIFNSTSKVFGHDGLYRFRHWVTALWFILPALSGVLAFVRGGEGYISQGPFCSLPIRPYWYRLALTWIPRYIVWLCIMFVAIRIYLHVGQGFRVFARQNDKLSSDENGSDSMDLGTQQELTVVKTRGPKPGELQDVSAFMQSGTTLLDGSSTQAPHVSWPPRLSHSADGVRLHPAGQARRGSRATINLDGRADHLQVPPDMKAPLASVSSSTSPRSSVDMSADAGIRPLSLGLAPISELHGPTNGGVAISPAENPLKKRRQAIQRQLRLLFIYPITYMIIWAVPFAYHSMYYSDYYAVHPVPALGALSVFFVTIAGFVDCVVFGWREKPWRHVPGSDGSFLGSFIFWRFNRHLMSNWSTPVPGRVPSIDDLEGQAQTAIKAKHWSGTTFRANSSNSTHQIIYSHKKTFSGTSERATRAAEQAAERLAMERQDRGSRVATRESSINPSSEWFERRLSECISPTKEKHDYDLFKDDDDDYVDNIGPVSSQSSSSSK